jgi:oligoribonuclease
MHRKFNSSNREHHSTISPYLFWIDLETTSLDHQKAKILELFVLVTDRDLAPIDSLELVIHYDATELDQVQISPWVTRQHANLLELVQKSSVTLADATTALARFFDFHAPGKKVMLAGSSVYFDRNVLQIQMPVVMSRLHHRVIDVSTLMELARRWNPHLHQFAPRKNQSHRARDDVYSSLNLMNFYRHYLFQPPIVYNGHRGFATNPVTVPPRLYLSE